MISSRFRIGNLVSVGVVLAVTGAGCVARRAPVTIQRMGGDSPLVLAECSDLRAARANVRDLKLTGRLNRPTEVVLREGVHPITAPLRFGPEDSGTKEAPVTYRAEAPGRATISGGIRIT